MNEDKDSSGKAIDGLKAPPSVPTEGPESPEEDFGPTISRGTTGIPTDVYKTSEGRTSEVILTEKGYTIGSKLGGGGFGVVYDTTFNEKLRKSGKGPPAARVACKVIEIKTGRRQKKKQLEELKNELTIMEKLPHEYIVKLFEHFIIDDKIYIFMELAKGGTLYDYVSGRGPFSEDVSRMYFKQMSSAVLFMHQKGYSHRDLKLLNVLLIDGKTKDVCKVADFGMSRVHFCIENGVLLCDSYAGTPLYMAPEIIAVKKARANKQPVVPYSPFIADIWALGICLYALTNKHWPFDDANIDGDMYDRMMAKKWRMIRKVRKIATPELQDLLERLLEPDPATRITFSGIYSHKWFKKGSLGSAGTASNSN